MAALSKKMLKLLMQLKILQIGDDRLLKQSKKIKNFKSKKLQKLIDDLIETCQVDEDRTAGLAAPQVGQNIQLTIVRRLDLEEEHSGRTNKKKRKFDLWEPVINPQIIRADKTKAVQWEGCLSIGVGEKAVFGPVSRARKVEIEYQDRKGKSKRLKGQEYFSHVLQHEIDHLHGILFTSLVANPEHNLWLSRDLDKYISEYNGFPEVV
jgi:peptide deformylase